MFVADWIYIVGLPVIFSTASTAFRGRCLFGGSEIPQKRRAPHVCLGGAASLCVFFLSLVRVHTFLCVRVPGLPVWWWWAPSSSPFVRVCYFFARNSVQILHALRAVFTYANRRYWRAKSGSGKCVYDMNVVGTKYSARAVLVLYVEVVLMLRQVTLVTGI